MTHVWPVTPAYTPPGGEFGSWVLDTGAEFVYSSGWKAVGTAAGAIEGGTGQTTPLLTVKKVG